MVTVVDAANLIRNYSSTDFLRNTGESLGEGDERTLVDLLVEQIEFANIILLNKVDLVTTTELKTVKAIIRSLNAKAKIIETTLSEVELGEVMDTGLFNLEEAQEHPMWAQELYNFKDHVPETEEYGITSFVYRARAPFHPAKIHAFFNQEWPGVVRAKGFFWLASRPDFVGEMSQAGAFVRHQGIGRWWASVPGDRWPEGADFDQVLRNYWDDDFGDRRQELVFIGLSSEMDEKAIRTRLDGCLAQDYLADPDSYLQVEDPFPAWFKQAS